MSGSSQRRLGILMKAGCSYADAKRTVLKRNFIRNWNEKMNKSAGVAVQSAHFTNGSVSMSHRSSLKYSQPTPRASTSQRSEHRDGLINLKVVHGKHPEIQLVRHQLAAVKSALLAAYDNLKVDAPQLRFEKFKIAGAGSLLVSCVDKTSADWLRDIVHKLTPWEGAVLKILSGDDNRKQVEEIDRNVAKCKVFVPFEDGKVLSVEKILHRLHVGNQGLNPYLWKIITANNVAGGRICVFSMNTESLEVLRSLNMKAYFGLSTLKFKFKGDVWAPWKLHK